MKSILAFQVLQQVFGWFQLHILGFLEAWLAIIYLRGLGVYRLSILSESKVDGKYFRCHCGLGLATQEHYAEAMAEGHTRWQARLRAVAEAYERLCLSLSGMRERREEHAPFGSAVAWQSKTACIRAFAEYHEREQQRELLAQIPAGKLHVFRNFESPLRTPVWICVLRDAAGSWGSGYGISQSAALDSAERSAARRRDFPGEVLMEYREAESKAQFVNITPAVHPWLECWCYGHIPNSVSGANLPNLHTL